MEIVLADLQGHLLEAWQKSGRGKEYVSTYHGSIFDVKCDALVSPANSFGFMDGGIDMEISHFFGGTYRNVYRELFKLGITVNCWWGKLKLLKQTTHKFLT